MHFLEDLYPSDAQLPIPAPTAKDFPSKSEMTHHQTQSMHNHVHAWPRLG